QIVPDVLCQVPARDRNDLLITRELDWHRKLLVLAVSRQTSEPPRQAAISPSLPLIASMRISLPLRRCSRVITSGGISRMVEPYRPHAITRTPCCSQRFRI